MNDPLLPALCEVQDIKAESQDVFTLTLAPPPQHRGFQSGQFNMLYIPGAGEVAISISGDPNDSSRLVHTIRSVGNVTRLLQAGQVKDRIGVRGPYGRGWPLVDAEGKDLILVAGGIGLAPLRPVLLSAMSRRSEFRRLLLFYGARRPDDLLFSEQLWQWKEQGSLELFVSVDTTSENWTGDVGVITESIPRANLDPTNTVAMVCGPEIMIRFSVRQLRECGMSAQNVYVSLERNMKCAIGHCGHCQLGPHFICKNGPVFGYKEVEHYLMAQGF